MGIAHLPPTHISKVFFCSFIPTHRSWLCRGGGLLSRRNLRELDVVRAWAFFACSARSVYGYPRLSPIVRYLLSRRVAQASRAVCLSSLPRRPFVFLSST